MLIDNSRNNVARGVKAATSDNDSIVQQFIETFNRLKESFQGRSATATEVYIHQTLTAAQRICKTFLLPNVITISDRPQWMIRRFAGNSETMAIDAPRIYLSCLTFISPHRPVHQRYSRLYPRGIKIRSDVVPLFIGFPLVLLEISTGDGVHSADFPPDSTRYVCGCCDNNLCVFDIGTGQWVIGLFVGHTSTVVSVRFSLDGKYIVSAAHAIRDNTIRIWNEQTGQLATCFSKSQIQAVSSVTFSPDGKYIVSGSSVGVVRVWDVHTSRVIVRLLPRNTYALRAVDFSPDGDYILTAQVMGL
jgi:WD40 repeat protein